MYFYFSVPFLSLSLSNHFHLHSWSSDVIAAHSDHVLAIRGEEKEGETEKEETCLAR